MIEQPSEWFPYRTHPKNKMVSVARRNPNTQRPDGIQEYRIPGTDWPKKFRSFATARDFANELNVKESNKEAAA